MVSVSNEYGQAICFHDICTRYIAYLSQEAIDKLKSATTIDWEHESRFDAIEIQAGLPQVFGHNISSLVPQMLNLQFLDAIDFDKGCYMGQEVVARTKFLGKNKRAAFYLSAKIPSDSTGIADEQSVEIQIGENWRKAGVINRIAIQGDSIVLLAVLPNDTEATNMLRLKSSQTHLDIMPLPYSVEA